MTDTLTIEKIVKMQRNALMERCLELEGQCMLLDARVKGLETEVASLRAGDGDNDAPGDSQPRAKNGRDRTRKPTPLVP